VLRRDSLIYLHRLRTRGDSREDRESRSSGSFARIDRRFRIFGHERVRVWTHSTDASSVITATSRSIVGLSLFLSLKIVDCDPRTSHASRARRMSFTSSFDKLIEIWKLCVSAHEEFGSRDWRLPFAFIRADLRDARISRARRKAHDAVDFFFEYLAGMRDASRLSSSSSRDKCPEVHSATSVFRYKQLESEFSTDSRARARTSDFWPT